MGEERLVGCLCKCAAEKLEKEREEHRIREKLLSIQKMKSAGLQDRRNVQSKPRKFENIFAELIKCADCGYTMTLAKAHRSPKDEIIDEYDYMCNNYKTFGKSIDTSHWIEARQLYECVLNYKSH